ncbi:autotransporter outer membrane beta-barrel domain-containing protein, partial [Brucella pseudintermedia]
SGDTVSGTPTKAGTFPVTVKATDKDGYVVEKSQDIVIAPRPSLEAKHHDLTIMAGTTGSVNLALGATGEAVTSATIVAHADAAAGKAWVESSANAQMLYFAASATFAGATELSYKLGSANGVSDPATVTIRVIARPDPSKDSEVIGLVSAQVQTASRMAQIQIRNLQQRLEQLHGEGECRKDSIGINVGLDGAQLNPKMAQVCTQRELSLWTAGEINMGKSSSEVNTKDKKLYHTSIGVSGGVDYRFSPSFIGGIGFGYGKDTTDVGENGTQSRASMFSLAAYGSYRPSKSFFLDGVVGYGWLNFESDRFVTATGGMASGERKGQQLFGSATLGYDYRNEAWLLSPYIRAEAAHTKLESFSETGAGIYNLTYGNQTADLLSTAIGFRGEYTIPMSWGTLKPKARVEYTHDFAGSSRVKLGYTDIGGLLPYTIDARGTTKDSIRIEAGFDAMINGDWSAGLDYSTQIATERGALEHSIRWKLTKQF